jgi:hypothetical protein
MLSIVRFSVAPILFSVFALIASYFYQPAASLEFVSLAFFATIAPFCVCIEHAQQTVIKNNNDPLFTYFAVDYSALLLTAGLFAGGLLATGGGAIRRSVELLFFYTFKLAGIPFRDCYKSSGGVFWPIDSDNWKAVGFGILLGISLGFAFTWKLSATIAVPRMNMIRSTVLRDTASVDGFGTAFFSAFGMEAAFRFIGGLPLGSSQSILPDFYSLVHITSFYVLVPIVVLIFAAVTSSGGGLLKESIVDVIVLKKNPLRTTIREWPWRGTTQCAAGIGLMGYVGYLLAEPGMQTLDSCQLIGPQRMLQIIVISGFLGFVIWGGVYRPRIVITK